MLVDFSKKKKLKTLYKFCTPAVSGHRSKVSCDFNGCATLATLATPTPPCECYKTNHRIWGLFLLALLVSAKMCENVVGISAQNMHKYIHK